MVLVRFGLTSKVSKTSVLTKLYYRTSCNFLGVANLFSPAGFRTQFFALKGRYPKPIRLQGNNPQRAYPSIVVFL